MVFANNKGKVWKIKKMINQNAYNMKIKYIWNILKLDECVSIPALNHSVLSIPSTIVQQYVLPFSSMSIM